MPDMIRRERKDFFFSYNMIFDQPLSEHAKIIYLYLCRCADDEGQSFPGRRKIAEKCSISDRTVDKAIKELINIGLLDKEVRHDGIKFTSNLYTIYNKPRELAAFSSEGSEGGSLGVAKEIRQGSEGGSLGVAKEIRQGSEGGSQEVLPNEVLPNEVLPSECVCGATRHTAAATPPPPPLAKKAQKKVPPEKAALPKASTPKGTNKKQNTQTIPQTTPEPQVVRDRNTYGEYQKVSLAAEDYNKLVDEYGLETVLEYIKRLDQHIASSKKVYGSHMATIQKWIRQDTTKAASQNTTPAVKPNRFSNFDQRSNDYTQIEQMAQDRLLQKLKA